MIRAMTTATTPAAPPLPASLDPLGELLHTVRMDGVFYARSEFSGPWGIDLPPMAGCLMFHVITAGRAWLTAEGQGPLQLRPGMFVLVPHGRGHQLRDSLDSPATPLFDIERELLTDRYELIRHGGGGEACHMICGAVQFNHPAAKRLIDLLPATISIDTWLTPQADWMQHTLRLMAAEAAAIRPGGETVITRLADILVIQAIRSWIAQDPAAHTGWLGAIQDEQIGRALLLIQRHPESPWSVASLADEVAMSRSAFAARFAELVGQTPMQYVRRWRMQHAASLLQERKHTIAELARALGYESEASFSRAFKREMGVAPGSVARSYGDQATKS